MAFVLRQIGFNSDRANRRRKDSLERIRLRLPFPPNLNPHFHALVDIICAALIIDTKLENIAIFERVIARFLVGRGEAGVVQEGAG